MSAPRRAVASSLLLLALAGCTRSSAPPHADTRAEAPPASTPATRPPATLPVVREPGPPPVAAPGPDLAAARAAFLEAYTVFMHPRCMNCHPAGDLPLQGDDSVPHAQLLSAGPDGTGVPGAMCTDCHQPFNLPGEHMPPGAPVWHLPHPDMPLVFEGLSPAALCDQLKDPARNGGKSLDDLLHHLDADPLVLWGWDPGDGRTTPPLDHATFMARIRTWIEAGAPCPQ